MICNACRARFTESGEQGAYSHYKKGGAKEFAHHYHLCKSCCKVVNAALRAVLIKGALKHLPDERKFK